MYPEPVHPSPDKVRWILIRGAEVLYHQDQASATIFMPNHTACEFVKGERVYLGMQDDIVYYTAGVPENAAIPKGWDSSPIRDISGVVAEEEVSIAAYAARIRDFDRSTAFCGMCGAQTRPLTTERARICTVCNRITYPRISPAVIVLITQGDEILLARSPRSPSGVYSVIAGFNEPGETLEQTVHREVAEEVGVTVHNLRYFRSEPWPFPDSLMIGFVAEYAGGEIRVDNREIESAGWFTRNTLPPYPSGVSISRDLIEAWIRREI